MPSTYAPNWQEVPCVDAQGNAATMINGARWHKRFVPQPFNTGGSIFGAPVWDDFTMDPAYYGLAYDEQWIMTNVTDPVNYSIVSGSLPGGLTLDNVDPAKGRIHGTPNALGTFNFTLRATNAVGHADRAFSIVVSPIPIGGFSV